MSVRLSEFLLKSSVAIVLRPACPRLPVIASTLSIIYLEGVNGYESRIPLYIVATGAFITYKHFQMGESCEIPGL